ncbi:MAG: hypothetical protein Tsb0034_21480 [Ekhidna sp.]
MIGDVRLIINESARKQIQKDVDRLTQSQTYYNILVDRMNLYFPYIEREHKKAGIPDEIKFLSIQESALISDAVSVANAVGFWQFKDFTAREVGLIVDRKVDERLNIVSSSRGSGKYFNSNNFFFDNWAYAVISYQAGAGGAKAHTNPSNYGSKRLTITTNTYWYLKKFIAHVVAFKPAVGRPHSEGIWLDEVTNAGGKTLEQVAREQGVDAEELKKYNKWLKRGSIPDDKQYSVMVPKKGTPPKRLVASNDGNEKKPGKISEPETKIYPSELKPGISKEDRSTIIPLNDIPSILARESDDVHSLSARAGISEKRFRKYNDMSSSDKIIAAEFYYVKKKKGKSPIGFHVAQKGETLWEVSQQYGIRVAKLAKKNRMSVIDDIKPGRVLWLSKTRPSDEPIAYHKVEPPAITKPTAQPVANKESSLVPNEKGDAMLPEELIDTEKIEEDVQPIVVPDVDSSAELRKVKIHTVAQGESLWGISQLYGVKLDDLLRWNDLPNPDAISIGQNIQVKAPIEEASQGKNIVSHTVQPGETMYAISRKYDMTVDEVMDLNGLKNFNLDVGQELKVYGK